MKNKRAIIAIILAIVMIFAMMPVYAAEAEYTNPLTGEVVDHDISMQRPFIVTLNNQYGALPQCGISSADVIYEICEEGVTRMLGVFAEMPDAYRLGSIRSGRTYHVDICLSYDAIFVHWGASNSASNLIYSTGIDDIDLNYGAYAYGYRDFTHGNGMVEHTGFVKIDSLKQYIADHSVRTEHTSERSYGFMFDDEKVATAGSAESVEVILNKKISNFTYYPEKNGYTMKEFNTDYVDGDTAIVPVFRNVMVLYANILNESGVASITLTNTSGTGYLFCDGKYQEITWSRGADYNDNFQYFDMNGNPLYLGVGKTFISLVSANDSVTF